MLALVSNRGGLSHLSESTDPLIGPLARSFQHANIAYGWNRGPQTFWDLIMPIFLFVVGVSMVFSLAKRQSQGATFVQSLPSATRRFLLLMALGGLLDSVSWQKPAFHLLGVLQVVGVCYFLGFCCYWLSFRKQVLLVILLLVGYAIAFEFIPAPGVIPGAYAKNANIGFYVDLVLFGTGQHRLDGLLAAGVYGYVFILVIPTVALVIFGIWTGHLLRSARPEREKLMILAAAAATGLIIGYISSFWIPFNRSLMTASFTLFTAGWAFLVLAVLYWLIDLRGYKKWAFPIVVVGMNPITIFALYELLGGWIGQTLRIFDRPLITALGAAGPTVQDWLVTLTLWLVCYWLYRNRIFLRV